jgi:pyrroline-5-carboxylate reductase
MALKQRTIAFIGGGHITSIILENLTRSGKTAGNQTINGSMELWNTRQVSPYNLISEASTPGGISTEITFTLEKKAFKAIITEALEAGYKKAAEFDTTSKYCTETEQSVPD